MEDKITIPKIKPDFHTPTKKIKQETSTQDGSEVKNEFLPQRIQVKEDENLKKNSSDALADQMFSEAQDLLMNSPWITTLHSSIDKESSLTTEPIVQDVSSAKKVKTEIVPEKETKNLTWLHLPPCQDTNIDNITDLHFTTDELPTDISAIHNFSQS